MRTNWLEIKRFLKDNRLFIIIGSIIIAVLFAVGMQFIGGSSSSENGTKEDVEQNQEATENANDTRSAQFQLYIENEDAGWFNNNNLLILYFTLDRVVEDIESATGVNLANIDENRQERGLPEDSALIHVYQDDSNGVMTFTVNTGNEEDNMAVANHIYGYFQNGTIDFLESRMIFHVRDPQLEMKNEEEQSSKETQPAQTEESASQSSTNPILQVIRNGILGLIIGAAIMIGLAFLQSLFSKKLKYSFAYDIDEDENHIVYDSTIGNENNLAKLVAEPFGKEKVILSEHSLENNDRNLLANDNRVSFKNGATDDTYLYERNSLVNTDVKSDFTEIIILVKPYETSRKWYNEQRKLVQLYSVPVKIVQLNA